MLSPRQFISRTSSTSLERTSSGNSQSVALPRQKQQKPQKQQRSDLLTGMEGANGRSSNTVDPRQGNGSQSSFSGPSNSYHRQSSHSSTSNLPPSSSHHNPAAYVSTLGCPASSAWASSGGYRNYRTLSRSLYYYPPGYSPHNHGDSEAMSHTSQATSHPSQVSQVSPSTPFFPHHPPTAPTATTFMTTVYESPLWRFSPYPSPYPSRRAIPFNNSSVHLGSGDQHNRYQGMYNE